MFSPKGVPRIFDAFLTQFWRISDAFWSVPLFPIKQDPFWRISDAFLTHFWRISDAFWLLPTPFPKTPFGRYRFRERAICHHKSLPSRPQHVCVYGAFPLDSLGREPKRDAWRPEVWQLKIPKGPFRTKKSTESKFTTARKDATAIAKRYGLWSEVLVFLGKRGRITVRTAKSYGGSKTLRIRAPYYF